MKAVCLSIQSADAKIYVETAAELREEFGYDIVVKGYNYDSVEEDPVLYHDMAKDSEDADLVFLRCMSDPTRFKRFEQYEKVLRRCRGDVFIFSGNLDVRLLYRELFKGTDEEFFLLSKYADLRGKDNDKGIFLWAYRKYNDPSVTLPEPVALRADGIYHPDRDREIGLEDYLATLDPKKPTAGYLFTSNLWVYNNLKHVDAIIRELESCGMNVIPVFYSVSTSRASDRAPASDVVRRYFTKDGKSRINVLLMNSPFSQLIGSRDADYGTETPAEQNFFRTLLNVPVIQVIMHTGEFKDYEATAEGPRKSEIRAMVAWPELDGQIISVPCSQSIAVPKRMEPLPDRVDHICRLAYNWAQLSMKKPSERKIALIMWQSRQESGRIGNAGSLDVPESIISILRRLKDDGYDVDHVPQDTKELMAELMDNVTNDFNWMSDSEILEKCIDKVDRKQYSEWFGKISEFNQNKMKEHWGEPPGTVTTVSDRMIIPGTMNGKILITYQPLRAWSEKSDSLYHDPVLSPPHQYLAFYRWLKDVYKVDAVVHMGTHGSLEWLPGKTVALSSKCYPDVILYSIPNIYPYMIDDPGEGIQAKRRSEAVLLGHLNATLTRADGYDDLTKIYDLVQEFIKMGPASDDRKGMILKDIYDEAVRLDILGDIMEKESPTVDDLKENIWKLHDYLSEINDALIRDGLHIFGSPPADERFVEAVYSLTRLKNGNIPSMRDSVLSCMGFDPSPIKDDPSSSTNGRLNSEILADADGKVMAILTKMHELGYDREQCLAIPGSVLGKTTDDLNTVISFICGTLVRNLKDTVNELDNLTEALSGRYVMPGPSGAPTRGNADILPTGRNYYGLDPDAIPTRSSWEIGKKMADQMIERYVSDKGEYPREIGFIIWATDTYKNDGDDVAYILWLMGVRPVWSSNGSQVTGLEVIPVKELGRPRLDVTVRITGLFRDTFPNLIDLIDDAVKMVAELDESDEDNQIAANLRSDIIEGITNGLTEDEARKRSSVRIFGCPPGAYGPGINHAVESSDWKTVQDLADVYITWGSSAYGRGLSGQSMKDEFVKRFSKVGVTVKNMPDREIDLFDIDDVYGYLGGLNAFVRTYGKKDAVSYMGDGSDPERTKVRSTKEESKYVFRSKILNPKYIDGMMKHGYRGAGEMSNMTEYVFGWDATSDIIEKWMYDGIAEKYLLDKKVREWMLDVNPHAMKEILDRLHEAIDRGMWDADEDMKEKLRDLYLEIEDRLEKLSDR